MLTSAAIVSTSVVVLAALASGFDVATRRIPNALTLGAALAGVAFHLAADGVSGGLTSVGGLLVGLAIFFPIFALGGMGAGDVKLLAALGAWLGPMNALWTAMFAAIAGGVMALVVTLTSGYAKQAFTNIWLLLSHWRVAGIEPLPSLTLRDGRGPRLAYALPIAAGVVLTLWLR